jgi:hypothetical protein
MKENLNFEEEKQIFFYSIDIYLTQYKTCLEYNGRFHYVRDSDYQMTL